MKHTPGPWEIDESGKHIQIYNTIGTLVVDRVARRERLLDGDTGKFSTNEISNAKLIAAAPDLLEAAKLFKKLIEDGFDYSGHKTLECLRLTEEAIKKAIE